MCRAVSRRVGWTGAGFLLVLQPVVARGQWVSQDAGAQPAPARSAPAQTSPSLDPTTPMDAMPDLGVEWPDLSSGGIESVEVPQVASLETRYSYRIDGLDDVEADLIRKRFEALSALAQHSGDPASAAQLDRRARQDADLLKQLMRAAGYYDADVAVEVDQQKAEPAVILHVAPHQRYTFESVDLAGLDQTGARADDLQQAFGLSAALRERHLSEAEGGLRRRWMQQLLVEYLPSGAGRAGRGVAGTGLVLTVWPSQAHWRAATRQWATAEDLRWDSMFVVQ